MNLTTQLNPETFKDLAFVFDAQGSGALCELVEDPNPPNHWHWRRLSDKKRHAEIGALLIQI